MTDVTATLLVDCRNALGEGVQWHPGHRRVYWTDIHGDTLWSCDADGGDVAHMALEAGLTAFAFTASGRMLAAFKDGICWLDLETGRREMKWPYQPDMQGTRMNDGTLDRQGRFVVGGINEGGDEAITPVWSVTRDGVREIISGVKCANSTAFSPDGEAMFFADSPSRVIRRYAYDRDTGTPSGEEAFATLREGEGVPDGSAVDAEGGLWNARYGGGAVQHYLPDGSLGMTVKVPAPDVTCCAFGGPDLDLLFITTARGDLSQGDMALYPSSGSLFVAQVPVRGVAAGYF
jgi:L-arabinonolactonase